MRGYTIMWAVFVVALWGGSCWYFYSMGRMHGATSANLEAAAFLRDANAQKPPRI